MMSDTNDRYLDLSQKIRSVLLRQWDPIGVRDIPEAQDEYDGFLPELCSMLMAHKSVTEVCNFLLWAEAVHMGLTANAQKSRRIAEVLVGLESVDRG